MPVNPQPWKPETGQTARRGTKIGGFHGEIFYRSSVFAIVIAIVIVILGRWRFRRFPSRPIRKLCRPVVQITAQYLGGNAQDLEKTVAQPIEEQLVGLDGMLYFFSRSCNDGTLTIHVTFELGHRIPISRPFRRKTA